MPLREKRPVFLGPGTGGRFIHLYQCGPAHGAGPCRRIAHGRARLCAARYGSGDVFEYGPRRAERVLQTAGGHGGIRRDLPGVGA